MPTKKKSAAATAAGKKQPKTKPKAKSKTQPTRAAKPTAAELKKARVGALAQVFKALGAKNPERWALNHVDKGTDELGRFVLLRAMWFRTVEPGRLLASARKDKHVGDAVDRLFKKADLVDLDALVRYAQRAALTDICKVLDDPAHNDDGIRWSVFRVDATGMPLWPLAELKKDLDDSEP